MPMIRLGQDDFHYRLDGPEGAPVLMLSDSLGCDLTMWDAQVPHWTRTHRVLRYDSRGHGQSAAPDRPCRSAAAACPGTGTGRGTHPGAADATTAGPRPADATTGRPRQALSPATTSGSARRAATATYEAPTSLTAQPSNCSIIDRATPARRCSASTHSSSTQATVPLAWNAGCTSPCRYPTRSLSPSTSATSSSCRSSVSIVVRTRSNTVRSTRVDVAKELAIPNRASASVLFASLTCTTLATD